MVGFDPLLRTCRRVVSFPLWHTLGDLQPILSVFEIRYGVSVEEIPTHTRREMYVRALQGTLRHCNRPRKNIIKDRMLFPCGP